MFADGKKTVSLRGKSKKEDRHTVLARAAREREERSKQRARQRAVLVLQATHRARCDMLLLRASLRAAFDAAITRSDANSFAVDAMALTRDLLLFHQHSVKSDGDRRRKLLTLVLQSAASLSAASGNACARACADDASRARWCHQMRRLLELCLPYLLGASPTEASLELHAASYFLDPDGWQWRALMPPAAAAALPGLASSLALGLADRGLYVHASAALGALLSPDGDGPAPPAEAPPLTAPLLALVVHGIRAECAAAAAAAIPQPVAFARELLCDPRVLLRAPQPLVALHFAPVVVPILQVLERSATRLPELLGPVNRSVRHSTTAVSIADPSASLLRHGHFAANLLLLVGAATGGANGSVGQVVGEALPAYVALLHACQTAVAAAFRLPKSKPSLAGAPERATRADMPSDSEESTEAMDVDSGPPVLPSALASTQEGERVEWERLAERLRPLPDHLAAIWQVALAPHAPAPLVACATPLAVLSAEALFSGGSAGPDGPQLHPRAASALSALAFGSDAAISRMWELTAAAQTEWAAGGGGALLAVFCTVLSHLLIAVDDDEFFDGARPFAAATLRPMVAALKTAALSIYWPPVSAASVAPRAAQPWPLLVPAQPPPALAGALLKLLRQLYDRDARRPFMGGPHAWFAEASRQQAIETLAQRMDPSVLDVAQAEPLARPEAAPSALGEGAGSVVEGAPLGLLTSGGAAGGHGGGGNGGGLPLSELPEARRITSVLLRMPFTLAFGSRIRVLRRWLGADREERLAAMLVGEVPHTITVRRGHLLADAHAALRGHGLQLRSPLRVRFLDSDGMEEAGIGEGVAKEFLVDVLKEGFDPTFGLFAATPDGLLYPNPAAPLRVADAYALYEFLGAILAKTLYEGILVELPLAPFFVSRLLGRTNTVADMPTLDRALYDSLMYVKRRASDEELLPLTLSFAVEQYTDETLPLSARRQVALKPGGAELVVKSSNRLEYVFLVSHYRLNTQMRRPCDAFLRGFSEVVPRAWVTMFSPNELQLVLGGSDAPLDIDDWRAHATYSGGYHPEHPVIRWLWTVIREFTPQQQAATLKFATSCSRPPLMGFAHLVPPFCVQRATDEEGRLPTAATCMNLLKLPPYDSLETLRERVTYAIESGAGFDLS